MLWSPFHNFAFWVNLIKTQDGDFHILFYFDNVWVRLALKFHLNVAATSIELSFSVLHTAHLSSVLAPAQAGLCIDMAPFKKWTLVQNMIKMSHETMTNLNRYVKIFSSQVLT